MDKLEFNSDGTIKPVRDSEAGVKQVKNFNPYVDITGPTLDRQSGIKTERAAEGDMCITSKKAAIGFNYLMLILEKVLRVFLQKLSVTLSVVPARCKHGHIRFSKL